MFDDFLKKSPMDEEIKPSKKRVKNNISAVKTLVEKEESPMTRRKFRLKPLIIAAAIMLASAVTLFTANAATKGAIFNFFLGGNKVEGNIDDYVDSKGYRHISFEATLPIYATNFAVIYDVDAPSDKAMRVITDETDRVFMDKIRRYNKAWVEYLNASAAYCMNSEHNAEPEDFDCEDFGLVFNDSEICIYHIGYLSWDNDFYSTDGAVGGNFMHTGIAEGHPNGFSIEEKHTEGGVHYDWETETKIWRETFYYYVGKPE